MLSYVLVASSTLTFRSVLFVRSFQFQYVQRMQDHHPTRFMSSGAYMRTPFLFPDVSQHFYTNTQSHFNIQRQQRPSRQPTRFGLALPDRLIKFRELIQKPFLSFFYGNMWRYGIRKYYLLCTGTGIHSPCVTNALASSNCGLSLATQRNTSTSLHGIVRYLYSHAYYFISFTAVIIMIGPSNFSVFMVCLALSVNLKASRLRRLPHNLSESCCAQKSHQCRKVAWAYRYDNSCSSSTAKPSMIYL